MFLVVVILINRISTAIININADNVPLMYTLLKKEPVRKLNSFCNTRLSLSKEKIIPYTLFKAKVKVFENRLNIAMVILVKCLHDVDQQKMAGSFLKITSWMTTILLIRTDPILSNSP